MKKLKKMKLASKLVAANFKVYSQTLNDGRLKKSEQLVFALIKSYLDNGLGFDKSTSFISAFLGYCEKTIITAISELEKKGFIVVVRSSNLRVIDFPKNAHRLDYFKKMLNEI